ncbi:Uncharacterized protein OS=Chthoniobacter flavus Ellin428 GN=CfE428DRAFT_2683 PE=4 SV=1: VWA_2: DUF1355 [Gemmataceae bacterium]|nr:Uncharacterized protein OS=Chthoniobacter flavus Ellin428 GN=CfE428DRAFT_2683 PE=4 SV=1: VWA_2: DUF1355 [Gemmataceae bacterium]VTT97682.1 Uncharacterized protein OS=Chthoniobacter flavus Ellin428 GN=CfE428DRAFT_2683 PE=4 SV=1: VWA_2: DUF1355 [Gemmataceae bacterium]
MPHLFAILWLSNLQLRGSFPWLVAAVLGLLAVAAVVVLYVRESAKVALAPRIAMALVRVAVVATVAVLLLRPVWVSEEKRDKVRPVAVLIDVSQSMDSADPRTTPEDQGRAAIAFGLIDADKGLPAETLSASHEKTLERPKRIDVARAALTNPKIDLFKSLAKVGPLEVYTFGTQRVGRDAAKDDWLKSLAATEPKTALVEAAFELLNRDDADAPAAIVIVSDGRENAGPRSLDDLARACNRRGIPISVYGVGSSTFGQLQVAFGSGAADKGGPGSRVGTDTDVPNTLFVDDITTVPVRYTVKGIAEGTANITLKYGDREVATKKETFTLTPEELRDGKTFATLMKFAPTKADAEGKKQEYSVAVAVTPTGARDPLDTLTGGLSRPAQVVSRKLKLLWVDGLPRRDFQFLQRDLLRDRRIDAKFYLTEGDRAAMRSGPPWMIEFSREVNGTLNIDRPEFRKILFDFDLVVLGDVPGKFFTKDQQEVIKEFVKEGGGLIHVAGRWNAPAAWAAEKGGPVKGDGSPIAEVLPVEFDAVRFPIQSLENPVGFVPVLDPAANRTQIVALEDDPIDNAERWGKRGNQTALGGSGKRLEPLYWYYPVTKVKPAADVFLVHPTARTPAPDNKEMPLLAGHYYGKGYALWVGFDDTWRWRFNLQNKLTSRFWTQAIYSAGIPRVVGTKLTQLSTNTIAPIEGTTGEYYVRVFNDNFQPLTADEVEGTLERVDAGPDDKDRTVPVKFQKVPGTEGEYAMTLPYNKVGQYRLTVDPKNKSPATLNFPVVYRDNHELAPGALDEPAMRKLSRQSRGSEADAGFYREETLVKLAGDLKAQKSPQSSRDEVLLWNQWAMLLLLGLLSAEWFLRKFNGMS